MKAQPRILYVCPMLCYPPAKGGHYRVYHVGRLLQQFGNVTMLCFDLDHYPPIPTEKATREKFPQLEIVKPLDPPKRNFLQRRFRQLTQWICVNSQYWGWTLTPEDQQRIRDLIRKHDLIWIERPNCVNLLGETDSKPVILDFDDLNHVKAEKKFQLDISKYGIQKRISQKLHNRILKKWEIAQARNADVYCLCSQDDIEYFQPVVGKPAILVPNGFEKPAMEPQWSAPERPCFGFLGSQQYPPNREGLELFVQEVWPIIRKKYPEAILRVAGPESPTKTAYQGIDGVEILGFVNSLEEEMKKWVCMVAPIYYGGGTRIKILEAWSRKCPVVSTTIGAYGVHPQDGENILLADTSELFAQRCMELLENPGISQHIAEHAYRHFVRLFTWEAVFPAIQQAVEQALEN